VYGDAGCPVHTLHTFSMLQWRIWRIPKPAHATAHISLCYEQHNTHPMLQLSIAIERWLWIKGHIDTSNSVSHTIRNHFGANHTFHLSVVRCTACSSGGHTQSLVFDLEEQACILNMLMPIHLVVSVVPDYCKWLPCQHCSLQNTYPLQQQVEVGVPYVFHFLHFKYKNRRGFSGPRSKTRGINWQK